MEWDFYEVRTNPTGAIVLHRLILVKKVLQIINMNPGLLHLTGIPSELGFGIL